MSATIGIPRVLLTTYATDASSAKLASLNCPSIINLAPPGQPWSGFKDKLVGMKRFLDTLGPRDVVCFTDAYDAICLSDDVDEIYEKFIAAEADVLFSAETSCFPWAHTSHLYNYTPTPYRYLNSGGYIGYVAALRLVLGHDMSQTPCDQGYFTYVYLNHINQTDMQAGGGGGVPPPPYRFKLDHECRLFQTAYAIPWTHFRVGEDGRFVNVKQGTKPCWVHFNGQQGEMKSGGSVMPIIAAAVRNRRPLDIGELAPQKKHDVIKERETDSEIVAMAEFAASTYVPPDPARIVKRDQVNHHAIFVGGSGSTVGPVRGTDFESKWHADNRNIIAQYFRRLASECRAPLDVSLHDYVGPSMNDAEWPHSVLAFSKRINDRHNTLIPDLYAMQNYKGALDEGGASGGAGGGAGAGAQIKNAAHVPATLKRKNKLLFIGKSTGARSFTLNRRIALCRYARGPGRSAWIEAYISGVANFDAGEAQKFRDLMHPEMTRGEQCAYRHLIVCDGNTACWDRLPWILASKSVCWKEESDHECWYYLLMKPWVHYIPFTLENLAETWEKVKDDLELQLRIVAAANEFVECYLRPECHALYARTLLDRIAEKSGAGAAAILASHAAAAAAATPISRGAAAPVSHGSHGSHGPASGLKDPELPADIDIVWYCGDIFSAWSPATQDLGGSEQAVVALSREWAALGKKVAVFGRFTEPREAAGDVAYYDTAHYRFDAARAYPTLIIWRYSGLLLLDKVPAFNARRVWVDLHDNDAHCYAIVARHQSRLHGVFFKSDFHREEYLRYAANHGRDVKGLRAHAVPNGVRLDMFRAAAGADSARDPYRFIYCSCYGRGLTALLRNVWPSVHRAEPRAELHLYYGIGEPYKNEPVFQELRAVLGDTLGVMNHGRRPAGEVAAVKKSAMFHLYPTKTPSETDCISVRESAASGCLPILLDYGVFKERDGLKVSGDPENLADGAAIAEQVLGWMRQPETMPGGSAAAARALFAASPTLVTWKYVAEHWLLRETTTREQERLLQLAAQRVMPTAHVRYLEKLRDDGFNPRVIYDIGSCVMHWTQEAQRIWPKARIICFEAYEPTEIVYRAAGAGTKQAPLLDYNIGVLGAEEGKSVRFWQNATMPGGNSCYREVGNAESAALFTEAGAVTRVTRTLDAVVRERGFPLPDLVKIDVQGAEHDVVAGGLVTLRAAEHLIAELQREHYNEGAPLADETQAYIESALGVACVAPLFCNNGPDGDYGFARGAL